jgi:hypothetical protein
MKLSLPAIRALLRRFLMPHRNRSIMPDPATRNARPSPTLVESIVLGPRYPRPTIPRAVEPESEWEKLVRVTAERRGLAHSCADYPNDPCGACAQGTGDPFASINSYRQQDSKRTA